MSPLSPRYVALPAAALAIIVGLAQARGQGTGQTGTPEGVHQVTSCTAPANTWWQLVRLPTVPALL